jgi:hypothetical protein
MIRRASLAPRLSAVLAVTGVAVLAVLAAGAITGSRPGHDRSRLDTDDVSAPATTSSTTTTEAEVLGVVVERSPVAPVASVPPATTEVPATAAPTTTTTTSAPAPAAAPTTSTTMAPPPPPPPPAPATATIGLTARGDGTVSVVLTGPDGSREIPLGPRGGSTRIEGLTPGNHQLFARVEGNAPPPDDDDTQVGGGVTMVPSDLVSIGAGQTLSATFDGSRWTLVLA